MRTVTCPGCGAELEALDTMDQNPPIPHDAWPDRWQLHDGDGGTLAECPACGEDSYTVLDGLPDYPWVAA